MRPLDPPFSWKVALVSEIEAAAHALDDPDPDHAIHQTRVRLKRVRTLARLGGADAISRTARALKYTLSGWRDLAALEGAARETAVNARKKGAAALIDIAAIGSRSSRKRPVNSSAKCMASHILPPFPQLMILAPCFRQ